MKPVLFFTHAGLIAQDAVFARGAAEQLGLTPVALVHGGLDAGRARATGAFAQVVDLIEGFQPRVGKGSEERALERLTALDYLSTEDSVRAAYLQDRWLTKRFGVQKSLVYADHVLSRLKSLPLTDTPVAMTGELTMLHHRLARMLFRRNAPYAFPVGSRFFNRFYLEDTLHFEWLDCQRLYRKFLTQKPVGETLSEAEKVIAGIRERDAAPAAFNLVKQHAAPSAEPLREKATLGRVRLNLDYWRYEFPELARNPRVLHSAWEMLPVSKMARWAKERARRGWTRGRMVSELPSSEFASLYLHYQPEYTVDTLAPAFRDQVEWVRLVSQSLPVGIRLLVKEQPFMLGARTIDFYRELLSLPNVDILAPEVNGRETARRSRAVFTLSGTVALEAMLLGVPAFIFSRVFHSGFEGIVRIGDPAELRVAVLRSLDAFQPASADARVAAIAAMHDASRPGQLFSAVISEQLLRDQENSRTLEASFAELLDTVIRRHQERSSEALSQTPHRETRTLGQRR
jgi:hypothetical protein